jgi:hypothetical protein
MISPILSGGEDAVDQDLEVASARVEAEGLAYRLQLHALEESEHVGKVHAPAADEGVDVVLDHAAVADVELEVVRDLAQAVTAYGALRRELLVLGPVEVGEGPGDHVAVLVPGRIGERLE